MNLRIKHYIPEFELPHEVITNTHYEVFTELQCKYPRLYNLSNKTGHKLLDELALIIGERLKVIMDTKPGFYDTSFVLSECYRKTHPHLTDFQLILSTLHRLQDACGAPRANLKQAELAASIEQSYEVHNIHIQQIKNACNEYNKSICSAVTAHVTALDSEPSPHDTEEDVARKKIREELKKILPQLPKGLHHIVTSYFVPEEEPHRRVRMYGEPFLPPEMIQSIVRRFNKVGSRALRSFRMYNLLQFKVNQIQYCALQAMHENVVNGAKLTIRSEGPMREISPRLRTQLAVHFGGTGVVSAKGDADFDRMDLGGDWQNRPAGHI